MYHELYYLFRPTEQLIEHLKHHDEEAKRFWLRSILWRKSNPDRTRYQRSDHLAEIKLAFLVQLIRDYTGSEEFEEIFGKLTLNLETFDRLWTIEVYDVEESFDFVEKEIPADFYDQMQLTGLPIVDFWIKKHRSK